MTGRAYGFYETLGFVIVGKGLLGKDNPTWDKEPVEFFLVSACSDILKQD